VQQGPFAPRALPRFSATTDPAATVSSSADFPGPPVIRPTLLRRFLDGTRTASPVARPVLVTVLPLPPRRSDLPPQPDCDKPCCLRPKREGSASGSCFLSRPPMSSLPLRPGDSFALPKRALSVGFTRFVSSTDATQATGLLALTPVGLTPTEHASLPWTHSLPKTRFSGNHGHLSRRIPRRGVPRPSRLHEAPPPDSDFDRWDEEAVLRHGWPPSGDHNQGGRNMEQLTIGCDLGDRWTQPLSSGGGRRWAR